MLWYPSTGSQPRRGLSRWRVHFKNTPPSTLGTLGRDLALREEPRQLVGSRIGGCRVVFSGGGSDALGRGLLVTVGGFSDM